MKRFITCLFLVNASACLLAQTPNEIAQFSQVYNLSTARVIGMNGAAGVLKSEFGAININPASLGLFQTGMLLITPATNMRNGQSEYLGVSLSDARTIPTIAGAGVAYSFENQDRRSVFHRFNVSFGYSYNNNFNTYYNYDKLTVPAGNMGKDKAFGQYLLDDFVHEYQFPFREEVKDPNNPDIHTGIYQLKENYNPISQTGKLTTTGSSVDYLLSFGTTYSDKLYMGLSVGMGNINFKRRTHIEEETNVLTYKMPVLLSNSTSGFGYNFRAGVIYTPINNLYLGIAAQSPTYYVLNVEENASLYVDEKGDPETTGNNKISLDNQYRYRLYTPWRFTFSAGYSFTSITTLALDYEIVTNNLISVKSLTSATDNAPAETTVNNFNAIHTHDFKLAMNIRLGGEVRLYNAFARAGVAYLGAPNEMIKGVLSGSFGLGYNFGDTSVDLAYRYAGNKEDFTLYRSSPFVTSSITNHLLALSVSYRF